MIKPAPIRLYLVTAIASASILLRPIPATPQSAEPPGAQSGDFLTLNVTKPLTAKSKAILEKLIEPPAASQLIETVAAEGEPVSAICADLTCSGVPRALNDANRAANRRGPANLDAPKFWRMEREGPSRESESKEFAVFSASDPIVQAAGRSDVNQPIVVPQDLLDAAGITWASSRQTSNEATTLLEDDLRVTSTSERSFRINRLLPENEVGELLASLSDGSEDTVAVTRSSVPKSTFSLIQFENTGTACVGDRPPHWPFDVERVKTVMEFNQDIRRKMKLGSLQRSRILIVDTGLGKLLAQTDQFYKMLYADPLEFMAPAAIAKDMHGHTCTDANENTYWRDVFGAGAGEAASDDRRCNESGVTAFDIVAPHPRRPLSPQIYNPDHGSFVAGLAVGGPEFIEAFPQISDYIGLTFFRVPRRSDSPDLHIVNEYADISKSLDYAAKIEADVINMSLKTANDAAFMPMKENKTALLVAAAGNNKEDIDGHASENQPASLNMPDRMIVVAALQSRTDVPLWPESAFSPTKVHIAAPGATISSFTSEGGEVCDSGTSAAAPLVSFVAATIKSLTGALRSTVRARILAAADHDPALDDWVEDGRRLNAEAALDVFVDRVELKDRVLRGWIEPDRTDLLVPVCQRTGGSFDALRGQIDLALLWEWRRTSDDKVALRYNGSTFEPFKKGSCVAPSGKFKFYDKTTKEPVEIEWSQVQKILPTPFRTSKSFVVN